MQITYESQHETDRPEHPGRSTGPALVPAVSFWIQLWEDGRQKTSEQANEHYETTEKLPQGGLLFQDEEPGKHIELVSTILDKSVGTPAHFL